MTTGSGDWEIEGSHGGSRPMGVRDFIQFFLSNALLLLIGVGAGVALGLYAQKVIPKAYESKGKFIVDQLPYIQASSNVDAETERQLVQTLILSIASRDMKMAIAKRLGIAPERLAFIGLDIPLKLKGAEPEANIEVTAVNNSRIGEIQATSQSPQFAADVVNALISELQIYNLLGGRQKNLQIELELAKAKTESSLKQLVEISAERIRLSREKAEMDDYVKRGLPLQAFPAFAEDPTLNNLKTQYILVKSEYDSIAASSTRGARLIGKKAELDDLTRQIKSYVDQLAVTLKSRNEIVQTREANLQAEFKETRDKIDELEQALARMAQSFGDSEQMEKLASQQNEGPVGPANIIVVVDQATPILKPVRPKLWLNLFLGVALGGALGLGIAMLRTLLDNKLSSAARVETLTGLPCLATIPRHKRRSTQHGVIFADAENIMGLGFLRSRFILASDPSPASRIVGFTPAAKWQRSSDLVADLAILLAQAEKRTLVVDMNVRDPQLAKALGITVKKDLATWLASDEDLHTFVNYSAVRELAAISPGTGKADWSDLLSRRPLVSSLIEMLNDWDYILIDAPPILRDWSLMLALPSSSPLIVTAEYRKTTADEVTRTARHARGPRWRTEGVVLLNAPKKAS